MTDFPPISFAAPPTPATPTPYIKKRSGPSLVWLIPLVTALIGGWLIVKTLSEKGPAITLTFKTAEGIEAGKTKIKYKDIEVGVVEEMHFNKDFSNIILKARIIKEAAHFLRRDTRFWVVRPRLSLRGVSGLSTLVSGAYIEIEPGQGSAQKHFIGLDTPPVLKADAAGKKVVLLSSKLGSLDTGSPVYYQGILVGEVLGYELGNDQKSIFIHAFIRNPYDELVKSNSRFWNVSGVDVSMGTEGFQIRTESMQSLIFGGIAFETPTTLEGVQENLEGLVFTLYDDYRSIKEEGFSKKIAFILFFEDSVRGLSIGAPVEFKGIKVGTVTDVRLEFDGRTSDFKIPVLIELEPDRVILRGEEKMASPSQILKTLVDRGLRARLQTGSLLTGQVFVELDMHPDTPVRLVSKDSSIPELPTISGVLAQITTAVKTVLAKLEKMDIDKIIHEAVSTLEGANRVINSPELMGTLKGTNALFNSPELRDSVSNLKESLASFQSILKKLDQRAEPIFQNVEKAIGTGNVTLEKLQTTLHLLDKVLEPDSPFQYRFNQLTEELAETARSIRAFVDLLERNPNSLIFGKNPPGEKK